jgi:hypothetical protein
MTRWLVMKAFPAAWRWLKPKLVWVVSALVAVLTLGLLAKRRKQGTKVALPSKDAEQLAEALRPSMRKRAEAALKEAEAHKAFADERIREAEAQRAKVEAMSADEVLKASQEYARQVRARKRGGGTTALLVLFASLALPSLVRAEDDVILMLHPSSGNVGWWVPDDVWRSALGDALELAEMHQAVRRLEASIEFRKLAVAELEKERDFERGLADLANAKLDETRRLLERERKWYRSPRFLVPLGVVLGAAIVIAPAVAFK